MNSVLKRRSYRKFKSVEVEQEKIDMIIKAGMQAPSACDQRPWEFIVVTNKDVLNKLANATTYSMCVKNSNLAIVPCYRNFGLKKEEYVICDMSACVENMLIEITELGLGGVWIGVAPNEGRINVLKGILSLDNKLIPFCIIPIGYPVREKEFEGRYDSSRIHYIV